MAKISQRKRIWGWFFFDWASQPYNTLLLTFIFAPYVTEVVGDGVKAQSLWGFTVGCAGVIIALCAPILGAVADTYGNRLKWVKLFSLLYVIGACGVWFAMPDGNHLILALTLFGLGLIGMEFATIFTNSILPDLGTRDEIGKISGSGWAFGYLGGFIALVITLGFFAESAATGKTFLGFKPFFGLNSDAREGTRFVGPFSALWYVVFMIPFFLWVRDPKPETPPEGALKNSLSQVVKTIRGLPKTPSLFAYLASSMFYRDALNGMYVFGGLYAAGVLEWNVVQTGVFGIIAIVSGAVFAWIGGRVDMRLGPKPVIRVSILLLIAVAICVIFVSRESVFGVEVDPASKLPDHIFYVLGAVIGAVGGTIQSASRTMMVRQANPKQMNEAFGLYALAGKATSFLAPIAIGIATHISGSQQIGVAPLIVLFLLGLVLLRWVHPEGGEEHGQAS
ncbi:Vacuole effluxer Atg22 like protein [Roseovarius albus]|uniref:Vacuole effluxer Atg22 like protein n=1 Tax=Roseovarius albus TaxID=1247867 RepID=A0A1X6YU76_9RHOB|nr:MFS transporter [Roseovarius albus]SLN30944.1 Vacuole effluxer Atg22 like protein [Roseovarius albus]